MCGICGFVSFDSRLPESSLRAMNARLERRGPDGEGFFFDGTVGLAMRRLSIIDLQGGWQPIFNEDRSVCVVFNGEIYNYRALRKQLEQRGHRFATQSDTEVIVHLYEDHGARLPQFLEGMFTFALWDLKKRQLLLARDRLGIKPLFIARTSDGLLFGSEIKALLAAKVVPDSLDWNAVDQYLAYTNVPAPRTVFSSIQQLMPGTTLTVTADGPPVTDRYWSLPVVMPEERSEQEWLSECAESLRAAVESHLVSDVPVGAFLSGGVDSSVLAAIMAETAGRKVDVFTVGFRDAGGAFPDERQQARALARRLNLNQIEIEVTPDFEAILNEVVEAFDQPFADDSVVPTYYVSKAASAKVKVALTGLGGDELFGGYRRHLGLLLGESYLRVPAWIRERVVRPAVQRLPEAYNSSDIVDHLKRFTRSGSQTAAARYQDSMVTLPWKERASLFTSSVRERIDPDVTASVMLLPFNVGEAVSPLERALRTDLQTYLVDDILTLTDRLSMWHSLELRVPYLDHRFVEKAAHIPSNLKIRGRLQKYLLKKLAERWMPKEMIYRRKQGFEAPMGRWLRGPLLPLFDSIVNRRDIERDGIFRYETIQRWRHEHVAGRRKHSKILFSLLMFQAWHNGHRRAAGSAVS